LRFLTNVLADAGYETLQAADGAQALRVCAAEQVDLVLTDLCMPEKEGFEIMQALRTGNPMVKVIAISGAFRGLLPVAKRLGADAVLPKPIDPDTLLNAVAKALAPS